MKFARSRFFIICAALAIVLTLIPATLVAFGRVDVVRSGLKTIAHPFAWCASRAADAVDGFVSVFADYERLNAENQNLKDRIEELEAQLADNALMQKENEWLKNFLEFKNNNPQLSLTDAKVISYEAGNYSTVLTLNRGSVHGVRVGMAVITADGVLGRVSEVGLDWSCVESIIESTSKVGVYTDRGSVLGVVEGSPEQRLEGVCIMSYDADADIKIGDRVYTSGGADSAYPGGLLIGKITDVKADTNTRRLVATVDPAVDFLSVRSIGDVMIVAGYAGHTGGN